MTIAAIPPRGETRERRILSNILHFGGRANPDDSAINSPAHLPLLQSERYRATLFPIARRGHKGRPRCSPCGGANRCAFRRGDFRNCGDALNVLRIGGARSSDTVLAN